MYRILRSPTTEPGRRGWEWRLGSPLSAPIFLAFPFPVNSLSTFYFPFRGLGQRFGCARHRYPLESTVHQFSEKLREDEKDGRVPACSNAFHTDFRRR